MSTLTLQGVCLSHGAVELVDSLDLTIGPGETVAVVGANGSGKTTLLRTIAGKRAGDGAASGRGAVRTSPTTATIGLWPQELGIRARETIAGFVGRRTGVQPATAALEAAAEDLAAHRPGAGGRYATALERWTALGGADLDTRTERVLDELGMRLDPQAFAGQLSGGQRARLGLAALMLSRHDVVLLDEPTNDLDDDGLAHLEAFVGALQVPVLVVSHDREFLARYATSVLEIDHLTRRARRFGGGFDAYLVERDRTRQHVLDAYDRQAQTVAGLRSRARTQRSWSERGVARERRQPRDNDRAARGTRKNATERRASGAARLERAVERLEPVEGPRREWVLQMRLSEAGRSGDVVLVAQDAEVDRGGFHLGPVNLQLDRGERLGVIGANGSGKSTLLALLLGELEPTRGEVHRGPGVTIGSIDQVRRLAEPNSSALEVTAHRLAHLGESERRSLLAKFQIGAALVNQPILHLSPGERTRLALAVLQADGAHLLVLDEPTNHLDLPAVEELEAALAGYDGTLVLVSHDRRLLEGVGLTRRLEVSAGRVSERR